MSNQRSVGNLVVERTMMGKVIKTWSTGCMCDLHPEYASLNKWSQGFTLVQVDKDGNFSVDNKSIDNGKIL